MPNITLYYSNNINQLDFPVIFQKLHTVLSSITTVASCKSKAIALDNYYIGEGKANHAILELQIHWLPGRDLATRNEIANSIYQDIILTDILPQLEQQQLICNPTISINDLASYYKIQQDSSYKQLS